MSGQFGHFPVEPLFLCSAHKNAALTLWSENRFFEKDQSPLLGVLQLLCFTCHSSDFMHAWLIRDQRLSMNVKQSSICQPASTSALLWTGNFSRFRSFSFFFPSFCKFRAWDRLQHLITLRGRGQDNIIGKRQCRIPTLLLLKCPIIYPCETFCAYKGLFWVSQETKVTVIMKVLLLMAVVNTVVITSIQPYPALMLDRSAYV